MPEQSRPSRAATHYTLYDMYADGLYVIARCNWCKITRVYRPDELAKLVGNVHLEKVQSAMRCTHCNRRDYMTCKTFLPAASERMKLKVRRIANSICAPCYLAR